MSDLNSVVQFRAKRKKPVAKLLANDKKRTRVEAFTVPPEVKEWVEKATAMINYLNASVDRLARENQQLYREIESLKK